MATSHTVVILFCLFKRRNVSYCNLSDHIVDTFFPSGGFNNVENKVRQFWFKCIWGMECNSYVNMR